MPARVANPASGSATSETWRAADRTWGSEVRGIEDSWAVARTNRSRVISALPRIVLPPDDRGLFNSIARNTMETTTIDPSKLEAFVMRALGDATAGYTGVIVSLGAKLGLYKALAGAGPSARVRSPSARSAPSATCASG
jgi:hypothetical protein